MSAEDRQVRLLRATADVIAKMNEAAERAVSEAMTAIAVGEATGRPQSEAIKEALRCAFYDGWHDGVAWHSDLVEGRQC